LRCVAAEAVLEQDGQAAAGIDAAKQQAVMREIDLAHAATT
jgi:hypothetical protein